MPALTPDQVKEYVARNGKVCPYCGKVDGPEGGPIEVENNEATQEVVCNGCNASWVDLFDLVLADVRPNRDPDDPEDDVPADPSDSDDDEFVF
jgi:hypothetical protein